MLIDAVALCRDRGCGVNLTLVGDGRYRSGLDAQVRRLRLAGEIEFRGALPAGKAVREELDRADLFVLPSRQEGLPRAMIEAMARGLPCVGSDVGGIPELLSPAEIVPAGQAGALAAVIVGLAADPDRRAGLGRENLERARLYHDAVLSRRRDEFYNAVAAKEKTAG